MRTPRTLLLKDPTLAPRRRHLATCSFAALALVVGCTNTQQLVRSDTMPKQANVVTSNDAIANTNTNADALRVRVATADDVDCQLYLKLATWDNKVFSNSICIKHKGQEIQLPTKIELLSTVPVKVKKYCAVGEQTVKGDTTTCVWNRQLYDNYPIDFTIATVADDIAGPKAAKPPEPLANYVSLVRVLRNNRTALTWRASERLPNHAVLTIPGRSLTQKEYFSSPVDLGLYILTSGIEESNAARSAGALTAMADWRQTLTRALQASATESAPPELKDAYACFRAKAGYLSHVGDKSSMDKSEAEIKKLNELAVASKKAYAAPLAVSAFIPSVVNVTLGERASLNGKDVAVKAMLLRQLRNGSGSFWTVGADGKWTEVDALPADVPKSGDSIYVKTANNEVFLVSKVEPVRGEHPIAPVYTAPIECSMPADSKKVLEELFTAHASADLKSAVDRVAPITSAVVKLSHELDVSLLNLPTEQQKRIKESLFWIQNVDKVVLSAFDAAENLRKAIPEIEKSALAAATDPVAHEKAYMAFAQSLPTDKTIFSKAETNPVPGKGENLLAMTYRDPSASYTLLAWHGIPIGIAKSAGVQTELKVDNAIPFVDIYGRFYQGGSFFGTTSLGFGILGTREHITTGGYTYTTAFNLGIQGNFSVRGIRAGLGYMIREPDGCGEKCDSIKEYAQNARQNFRFLIGADLIKLITGTDTAVDVSPAGSPESQ